MSAEEFHAAAPKKSESQMQISVFKDLENIPFRGGTVKDYVYAVPNGGYRTKKTGAVLKAEGVKRGVPDIHCFVAIPPFNSLYVELKTEIGTLSPDQEAVIKLLRMEGHKVVICRSEKSVIEQILKYLGIEK